MNNLKKIFDADTWDEIFESISKNRTRTIITTIGVFWGIFIYIALAGSATGLENGFDDAFSGLSKNSMGIWVQSTSDRKSTRLNSSHSSVSRMPSSA